MFSGLPCETYSTYSKEPGESGCSVACLVRYSRYSTYSKEPGESGCSAGWRSVRAAFCMVFAWFFATCGTACFLHGFARFLQRGTACFLQHVEQLFLHDTWSSLHVFSHGFARFLHDMCMWFNPKAPPVFVEQLVFCTVLHGFCMTCACGSTPKRPLFSLFFARFCTVFA